MKVFIITLVVLLGSVTAEPELAQFGNIFDDLINKGLDFVCSAEMDEILAQLNLPESMMGLVTMAKTILCNGRGL